VSEHLVRSLPIISTALVVALAPEAQAQTTSFRNSDPDDISTYGIAIYASGGVVQARDIGLFVAASDEQPDPLRDAELSLVGVGGSAGLSTRPFYQWSDGFRISGSFTVDAFEGLRVQKVGGTPGSSVDSPSGAVFALEGAGGKAFDAGWSYPYVDVGLAGQMIVVDVPLRLSGIGRVGSTGYLGGGAAPFVRAGWWIPIDRDFYLDVAISYRAWGMMGGNVSVGLGTSK
jgi:hypothetical protein